MASLLIPILSGGHYEAKSSAAAIRSTGRQTSFSTEPDANLLYVGMIDRLLQLMGIILFLATAADIFLTVLYARSGSGVVAPQLNKVIWYVFRKVAGQWEGRRRNGLLTFCGPVMLVVDVLVWAFLLVVSFALIYLPAMGPGVGFGSPETTDTGFFAAMRYSGCCLTTLGVGSLYAKSALYHSITIVQAGIGFSFLTLTLTYFMSVYNAVVARNSFGNDLHMMTLETGDAVPLISGIIAQGDTTETFSSIRRNLLEVLESHHSYPILHYFRFVESHYSLERMLLVTLDTVTLCRSTLDKQEHDNLLHSAALNGLWRCGNSMIEYLVPVILTSPYKREISDDADERELQAWSKRFDKAYDGLQRHNIVLREDKDAARRDYIDERKGWHSTLEQLSSYMGRTWSTIDPALNDADQ